MAYQDKFVQVDGLKSRYIEEGSGPAVICLHGASLGSSADVFERNLAPLAKTGLCVIAFDFPGFELTDNPGDHSGGYRNKFLMQFMDAMGLQKAAIMKEKFPQLDLHIVDNCKHLVQWDAMDEFHRMAKKFLPN